MKYVKDELYKLNHSFQGRICILLVSLMAIFLTVANIVIGKGSEDSFLTFPMYLISNIQNVYILIIVAIIATTNLFDKEFQNRTYIYIFIRPISWLHLFISKILASFLYMLEILSGILIFSLVIGLFVGTIKPCSELDPNLLSSIIRLLGYFFIVAISFFFIISLTSIVSINARNQITSIVVGIILFFITIILMISIFPGDKSFTPFYYLFFSQDVSNLYTISIIKRVIKGIFILALYSLIPMYFTYRIGNKIRKGEKYV